MVIHIKGSTSMDCPRAMGNIFGVMVAITKVILSKVSEMDSVFGKKVINRTVNPTEGTIFWTVRPATVFIFGKMVTITKVSSSKMFDTGTVSSIAGTRWCIKEHGRMVSRLHI